MTFDLGWPGSALAKCQHTKIEHISGTVCGTATLFSDSDRSWNGLWRHMNARICVGKIRKYEMVKCEILKIAIYLVNIALVDEKVKSLIGNRGRSFRFRHFQQPTTTSSGWSIDDVTSGMWTNANYQKTDPRMHRWALTQRVRRASSCFKSLAVIDHFA